MKFSQWILPLASALAFPLAVPASAQQKAVFQQLVPAQSNISFVAKQMGVPVEGHFRKFDAQISFESTKPSASKVTFTVDTTSDTLGSPQTDSELPKPDWFNTTKFPQASFASTNFKALGAGKYEVAGKLSIKGQTHDVLVPVTMTQTGAVTVAAGQFMIKRLTYKIGDNEWTDTSIVADDVQVKFKLALSGVNKF